MIDKMLLRGAKAHNLKNIDADIPLGKIVGIGVFCVGADALIGPLPALEGIEMPRLVGQAVALSYENYFTMLCA